MAGAADRDRPLEARDAHRGPREGARRMGRLGSDGRRAAGPRAAGSRRAAIRARAADAPAPRTARRGPRDPRATGTLRQAAAARSLRAAESRVIRPGPRAADGAA